MCVSELAATPKTDVHNFVQPKPPFESQNRPGFGDCLEYTIHVIKVLASND